jgi:hypothetical protein
MSVTTRTVWGDNFTEEHKVKWDVFKSEWLAAAIDSEKTTEQGTPIEGVQYGGLRSWKDEKTAEEWKHLVESFATKVKVNVTVTLE